MAGAFEEMFRAQRAFQPQESTTTWGDVADTAMSAADRATDADFLRGVNPGHILGRGMRSSINVASGEGDAEDAWNLADTAATFIPGGAFAKLATFLPIVPALKKIRSPKEWGSFERSDEAIEKLLMGEKPQDVWGEYGVTLSHDGKGLPMPMTALDTRDVKLKDVKAKTLGDALEHPELYAMDERLARVPVSMTVDPQADVGFHAATMTDVPDSRHYRNMFGLHRRADVNAVPTFDMGSGPRRAMGITAHAQNRDVLASGLVHEVDHAGSLPFGGPKGTTVGHAEAAYDTDMAQMIAQELRRKYGDVMNAPAPELSLLDRRARMGGYYDNTGEKLARTAAAAFESKVGPQQALYINPYGPSATRAHAVDPKEPLSLYRRRGFEPGDFNMESELLEALDPAEAAGAFAVRRSLGGR